MQTFINHMREKVEISRWDYHLTNILLILILIETILNVGNYLIG